MSKQKRPNYSGLKAVFINCTLKKNGDESHTKKLMSASEKIMEKAKVKVTHIHALSHDLAFGVYPDMKEHGWKRDDWPKIWKQIKAADILVLGTPIWLGEESSICRLVIERLY